MCPGTTKQLSEIKTRDGGEKTYHPKRETRVYRNRNQFPQAVHPLYHPLPPSRPSDFSFLSFTSWCEGKESQSRRNRAGSTRAQLRWPSFAPRRRRCRTGISSTWRRCRSRRWSLFPAGKQNVKAELRECEMTPVHTHTHTHVHVQRGPCLLRILATTDTHALHKT